MHPLTPHPNPFFPSHKTAALGLALIALLSAPGTPLVAQEWIPSKCCPERDCQGDSLKVTEVSGGYAVEGVPGIVAYDDPRLQPSQDGRFHACLRSAARPWMNQTQTLIQSRNREIKCLFVPLLG